MGEKAVGLANTKKQQRDFVKFLLNDIAGLEEMLERGLIESGVQRIGAEQELCFVDHKWKPAPVVLDVLESLRDEHFTTELAKFNMEINLDPLVFRDDCLSRMEEQIISLLNASDKAAAKHGAKVILTGILPSIIRSDLENQNMTPFSRYKSLNESLTTLRGEPFEFRIKGVDELITKHTSTMFESANTSFQIHLQLSPGEFVEKYNWAQAISGPVLAACTNSPLLFGKRLWRETRIALFQQSHDTRNSSSVVREQSPRVTFGNRWVKDSLLEIYKEDVTRYRTLLTMDVEEDALKVLRNGKIPTLNALRIHNGTIYRWNRACYGISIKGLPHVRIENRYIPAGPSVRDEMANAAFWLGLMNDIPDQYRNVSTVMRFEDAKMNFLKAGRMGLGAQFKWINGKTIPSHELILDELLPMAKKGLMKAGIINSDIEKYLSVIEERVSTEMTGSQWMLDSFATLKKQGTRNAALATLTAAIHNRQNKRNIPVHKWKLAELNEGGTWVDKYSNIEQIMSTDLFTVHKDEFLPLASSIMNWRHVRHIPVEDDRGHLLGLLTSRSIMNYYSKTKKAGSQDISVSEVMLKKPVTISPKTKTLDAIKLMRKHKVGCLPVVKQKKLVGIVTEYDFLNISEHLLNELEHIRTRSSN